MHLVVSPDGLWQIHGDNVPIEFEHAELKEHYLKMKEMKAFNDWCREMDEELVVSKVVVQSIDLFGPRIGFLKFKAEATTRDGKPVPGIVFMRGGAVAIFIIITCKESKKQYTMLTVQPRVPVGKAAMYELPAGMLDNSGDFVGMAAKELEEETSLKVQKKDLIDLTEKAFGSGCSGIYPSAGGCDEYLRIFLYRTTMSPEEISSLHDKCTGVLEEGETIKLKVIPIDDLW